MLAAAGPFSCSDDLAYAPLDALLETAAKEVPAALILLGPFVDENHPMMTEVRARSPKRAPPPPHTSTSQPNAPTPPTPHLSHAPPPPSSISPQALPLHFDDFFEQHVMSRIVACTEKQLAAAATPAPPPPHAPPAPATPRHHPAAPPPRPPRLSISRHASRPLQIVLVPSIRDVHHHPVYPQPGFEWEKKISGIGKAARKHLHCVSNPATFEIEGVRVSCCSADVLMLLGQQARRHRPSPPSPPTAPHRPSPPTHLPALTPPSSSSPSPLQEISKAPAGQKRPERLSRLSSHVLTQRTFLPIFPAPPSAGQPPPAVDVVASLSTATLAAAPDVLILPSDLSPFAKPADAGVVAVNPGRLARMKAGGSYATIVVHPPAGAAAAPADGAAADGAAAEEGDGG